MEQVERFMRKVQRTDSCWLWTGGRSAQGYGRFRLVDGSALAHRWAYEYFVGPIPPGLTVDHLCHNRDRDCNLGAACSHRACVRPDHLGLATRRENILSGRTIAALNAAKTHCPQGHPYDKENTRVGMGGRRFCRRCY